ncbi:MAG: STAS domain-containing protein [Planctomycetota bacterium]|nr:MAG: STAS domain-containing protein [Planctomycetota bacterium]
MAGLDIKLTTIEGDDLSALAEMTGAIDGNTVPSFQAALEELKGKGIRRLVLDMSKIKYVNSTGLGSLVKYADAFKSNGGGMALIKVPAKVKIVIEMLGLNAFFDICADLDAALDALKNAASAAPSSEAPGTPSSAPPRVSKGDSGASAAPPRVSGPSAAPASTAPGSGAFPRVIDCQGCTVKVEVSSPGNWKCPRCYTRLSVQPDGSVGFGKSEPVPLSLSLTATKDCGEGLVHLVTSVCSTAFNGPQLENLRFAVHEIAQVMQQSVYAGNPGGVYHVCIERQPGRVQIRFSDHGATIESTRTAQFFPHSSSKLTEFECRPHPAGGNTIRLLQTG